MYSISHKNVLWLVWEWLYHCNHETIRSYYSRVTQCHRPIAIFMRAIAWNMQTQRVTIKMQFSDLCIWLNVRNHPLVSGSKDQDEFLNAPKQLTFSVPSLWIKYVLYRFIASSITSFHGTRISLNALIKIVHFNHDMDFSAVCATNANHTILMVMNDIRSTHNRANKITSYFHKDLYIYIVFIMLETGIWRAILLFEHTRASNTIRAFYWWDK